MNNDPLVYTIVLELESVKIQSWKAVFTIIFFFVLNIKSVTDIHDTNPWRIEGKCWLIMIKSILKKVIYADARRYYKIQEFVELSKLKKSLKEKKLFIKTASDSCDLYQEYDNREQLDYENAVWLSLFKGKICNMSAYDVRQEYLKYLYQEIDTLLQKQPTLKVLEVGCGNCINLLNIRKKYGDKIVLTGMDISNQRIKVAQKHYKEKIEGIPFHIADITKGMEEWQDGTFDLVFSMHCLEQIAYKSEQAVAEMHRLASKKIVMIEPVFEFGVPAQQLKLINSDHTRILLKSIHELGYTLSRSEPLDIQGKPLNQSSILVIDI